MSIRFRPSSMPVIEPLEGRQLLTLILPPMLGMFGPQIAEPAAEEDHSPKAGRFVIGFFGLGGANTSYGQDWFEKAADNAGFQKRAAVRKYDEDKGTQALTELFASIDKNADHIIDKREAKKTSLRVIGYSFGGIAAINLARELNRVGETVHGYLLGSAVKVRSLVALDPVNHNGRHTDGVPTNVKRFSSFYQQKGGNTSVNVYIKTFGIKVHVQTVTVSDPLNITGDFIVSLAKKSKQVRVDTVFSDKKISHSIGNSLFGEIKGKNVNHGTLPFFAYGQAVSKLKK